MSGSSQTILKRKQLIGWIGAPLIQTATGQGAMIMHLTSSSRSTIAGWRSRIAETFQKKNFKVIFSFSYPYKNLENSLLIFLICKGCNFWYIVDIPDEYVLDILFPNLGTTNIVHSVYGKCLAYDWTIGNIVLTEKNFKYEENYHL